MAALRCVLKDELVILDLLLPEEPFVNPVRFLSEIEETGVEVALLFWFARVKDIRQGFLGSWVQLLLVVHVETVEGERHTDCF